MSYHKRGRDMISEWYEQYGESIMKFIYMMVRDYSQAEDLTHETFLKAYEHYDAYEGKASAKTWLFRIAHNVTIDYLRKKKPLRLIEEFLQTKRDPHPLPEDILYMKENKKELYQALGNLRTSYKTIIILRYIKGFSVQETCDILNWSESKVKTTLHRAMSRLEKELRKEGIFSERTT